MTDILCIGMALVDSIIRGFQPEPVSASGYIAESCTLNAGGEAVNAASAAARLGMKTRILCALGDDAAGLIVRGALLVAGQHAAHGWHAGRGLRGQFLPQHALLRNGFAPHCRNDFLGTAVMIL